ncbi:hypothetical protein BpHYR1_021554 [Brachionus plicatilis]|uniref:Uncharacterized protein n=1 Tax=Brachionus plicatilis TaxID=10195 RepID=A0A3M7SXR5_BRAPC|nr:hypothetical protein BpHYR1_021554 [Brachionus plicatilis]
MLDLEEIFLRKSLHSTSSVLQLNTVCDLSTRIQKNLNFYVLSWLIGHRLCYRFYCFLDFFLFLTYFT